MPRKGYKAITVRQEFFEQIKKKAKAMNVAIPEYLVILVTKEG